MTKYLRIGLIILLLISLLGSVGWQVMSGITQGQITAIYEVITIMPLETRAMLFILILGFLYGILFAIIDLFD